MDIVVLVKQVPEIALIKVDAAANQVVLPQGPGTVNPFDEYALEESLRLKEKHGGKVIVMSMGNELRGKDEYLTGLVEQAMRKDSRRLYACATHHHRSKADQFRVTMRVGRKLIRGLRAPGTDWDFAESAPCADS